MKKIIFAAKSSFWGACDEESYTNPLGFAISPLSRGNFYTPKISYSPFQSSPLDKEGLGEICQTKSTFTITLNKKSRAQALLFIFWNDKYYFLIIASIAANEPLSFSLIMI